MSLCYSAVDTSQHTSPEKSNIIAGSSNIQNVSTISNWTILGKKSQFNQLRYFDGNFNALNIQYTLVCSGNDNLVFTFLSTLTPKDIYARSITIAKGLLYPIRRYYCAIAKVKKAAGNLKFSKWGWLRTREDEPIYYKRNSRSLLNRLDRHAILVDQSTEQNADLTLTSGLMALKRACQRFSQWTIKLPFSGVVSGINMYMKGITKRCTNVKPTKHSMIFGRYGTKQVRGGKFNIYSSNQFVAGLLKCTKYSLCGNTMQKRFGFCHRFLTVASMKHFLRKRCIKINRRVDTTQNNSFLYGGDSSFKCLLTDSSQKGTVTISEKVTSSVDQRVSSFSYSNEYDVVADMCTVHKEYCEADTTERCDDSLVRNDEYSETNGDMTTYTTLQSTGDHGNFQTAGNGTLHKLSASLQISHQLRRDLTMIASPQLYESNSTGRQDTVRDILQSKLFYKRSLSEVFQSNTTSKNIVFLVQYLLQCSSNLLYETQKDSASLEDAVKTFLEGLGGDEDLLNSLAIISHSMAESPVSALETLLTYMHDDSYIMNDFRSILIRLLAEQCWRDLFSRGYSLCYCNALRGIAPAGVSSRKQEVEKDGWTPWFRYVEQGNLVAVRRLIGQYNRSHLNVFVSAMEYGPWLPTATMMTVILKDAQVFDILSGIEIRMQDKCLGYSALMIAVLIGWDYAVEALAHSKIIECKIENSDGIRSYSIMQHSEIGIKDIMGKTALVCAVEMNRTPYINMLISEARLTNGVGTPAIAYAMDPAKLNIFKRLLPLEYNCKDAVGNDVLYYAKKARIKLFSQLVWSALSSQRC